MFLKLDLILQCHMNYELKSRSACCLKLEFIQDIIGQCQYTIPCMYHIKAAWRAAVSKNPH